MCSSSPAPDPGIGQAAMANAAISKDALEWYKQQYAAGAGDRAAAANMNQKVSQADLDALKTNTALSNDYANYNKQTFRPIEQDIASKAMSYDTEGNRERLAGLAAGDVQTSFANAEGQQDRNMARMGVNPNDGVFASGGALMATNKALATADAENKAREQATLTGHAMEMDAASLGRGLPGNQATSAGIALNAGAGATNAAGMTLAQQNAAQGVMGQGYNTAISGNNSAGNLYLGQYNAQNQASAGNGAAMAGLGSAIGGIAMAI